MDLLGKSHWPTSLIRRRLEEADCPLCAVLRADAPPQFLEEQVAVFMNVLENPAIEGPSLADDMRYQEFLAAGARPALPGRHTGGAIPIVIFLPIMYKMLVFTGGAIPILVFICLPIMYQIIFGGGSVLILYVTDH
jgi:hypothetical protein